MQTIRETRRAGQRGRVSEGVVADAFRDTASTPNLQASYLVARYAISASVARVVAEHAFAKGVQR